MVAPNLFLVAPSTCLVVVDWPTAGELPKSEGVADLDLITKIPVRGVADLDLIEIV